MVSLVVQVRLAAVLRNKAQARGQSALDPKAVAQLCNQIEPKIIIPIQFSLPSAAYEAEKVDKFVKEIGLPAEKMANFRIAKKQLPVDQTRLIILEA